MYQALLTRRYLTTKIMPLLAAAAVMLCAAMVLIVWSIMGGFLVMFLNAGRTMMGDVSITWGTAGFAYYQELIDDLQKHPEVAAASPLIESYGMISLPDERVKFAKVIGIDGESFAKVTGYADSLWWKPLDKPLPRDTEKQDPRLHDMRPWAKYLEDGLRLTEFDRDTNEPLGAAVPGIEVSGFNNRTPGGWFVWGNFGIRTPDGRIDYNGGSMLTDLKVTLSIVPVTKRGVNIDIISRSFPVANEFKSGLFEIDQNQVFVRISDLQEMLQMDAAEQVVSRRDAVEGVGFDVDPVTGKESFEEIKTAGVDPARVTTVYVRGAPGVTSEDLAAVCKDVYAAFAERHKGEVPPIGSPKGGNIAIKTWRQLQGHMIAAVEKETGLVLFINTFISMVASFLILAIFWAMVSEKTKDIGVLRSMGAGKRGVAGIWLFYGTMIGVIGSSLGILIACGIVWNINEIHEWMGRFLGVTIWDPQIYYFSEIPHDVDPKKVAMVFAGGMFFSVLGALVPALRAASMDPVRALRFE